MFEGILLEREQKELLEALVEASRNVTRSQRCKFMLAQDRAGSVILHAGLPNGELEAYKGDIEALGREGLLALSYNERGTLLFDVTSQGLKYYEKLKQDAGQPVVRVQNVVRDYLSADQFRQKHPQAYEKWSKAEAMLWSSDSEEQLTTIGHRCREAMQEFAADLVQCYRPPDVDKDKAKAVSRIRAVVEQQANKLGGTERGLLDALVDYWRSVSELVQRQEHGAEKEGESLVWEDGRRVVFQTMVVMYEIER